METSLFNYLLHLGDNALILGHRNSEWCGHGPVLEQDIALTNIALDLIGQARLFYQYAATLRENTRSLQPKMGGSSPEGQPVTEDSLAYFRDAGEFRNCLLVEQPNGDWAHTILRQFFFSAYQYELYNAMQYSKDAQIAAIAQKALKEVTYHVRWSGEWVVRLGDGTRESRDRMCAATSDLWMFTGELFTSSPYEKALHSSGISVPAEHGKDLWDERLQRVFEEAELEIPQDPSFQSGGKTGVHSEHLGYILAELQFLQRAYPGSNW